MKTMKKEFWENRVCPVLSFCVTWLCGWWDIWLNTCCLCYCWMCSYVFYLGFGGYHIFLSLCDICYLLEGFAGFYGGYYDVQLLCDFCYFLRSIAGVDKIEVPIYTFTWDVLSILKHSFSPSLDLRSMTLLIKFDVFDG
jgi:hypothetical protein